MCFQLPYPSWPRALGGFNSVQSIQGARGSSHLGKICCIFYCFPHLPPVIHAMTLRTSRSSMPVSTIVSASVMKRTLVRCWQNRHRGKLTPRMSSCASQYARISSTRHTSCHSCDAARICTALLQGRPVRACAPWQRTADWLLQLFGRVAN